MDLRRLRSRCRCPSQAYRSHDRHSRRLHLCVRFSSLSFSLFPTNASLNSFGGTDGQYHYNDTWCYDTNSGIWVELSCIGYIPVPREGHAATLVDDVMYVFGGRGVDGKDLEDLAAFKITSESSRLSFEPRR
jgi:hypothetical protein